ncbi:MAG: hypothetical protein AAFU03_10985 [Bacteroidota bacterium]
MKHVFFLPLFLFAFLLTAPSISAQAWKNSETRQSINRTATVQKRILNNENARSRSQDETMQGIFDERIALLRSIEQDIEQWTAQIEAGAQNNAYRYNLLTNIKLGKADAMQSLLNSRTAELLYVAFGGNFKEEALGVLTTLRTELGNRLGAYDDAINQLMANME